MEKQNLKEEDIETTSRSQNQEAVVQDQEEKSITLGQIWHMIKKHWVAAGVCALLGFGAAFAYAKFIKSPSYQASVQMMVVADEGSTSTDNISISTRKAAIAYGYLTSDDVVEKSTEKLAANEKYTKALTTTENGETKYNTLQFKKYYTVTISTVGSTSTTSIFLTITSTCKSEEMAIDVANCVANTSIELTNSDQYAIHNLLGDSLNIIQEAKQAKDTSTSTVVISLIGVLAGLVVGIAYAIIRELTDTRVTSKSELESVTGYKVIGMVPKYEAIKETKKGENENDRK